MAQIANCKLQIANCKLVAGGLRWEVAAQYRELLLRPDGLRLDEWLQAGQARVVKHGPHRTVYRVALPELSFYVKHCRLTGIRAWARELVRPPKARIEYEKALLVAKRGVPTITPLAVGHRSFTAGPGDSFLVTRALEDTEPLNSFLENRLPAFEPSRQTTLRQRLAIMLGGFTARMHDAGIRHDDLHPGNLLVHLDAGDRPSLYLIDLHAVRLGLPLQWRASRENLVIFNRWFVLRASRTDRLRFWKAYWAARSAERGARNAQALRALRSALSVDLEGRTWQSNLRFWRRRDRRCLSTNRYYYRIQSGSAVGQAVRDLDRTILEPLLADPDAPFRRPGVVLLKDSRSSTVAEFELEVDGVSRPVIYKRFRAAALSDPWKALLRPTAALRSWVFGHGLHERGLPTPRPLAVFHRRRGGLLREGYLVTEKVPNAVDLHSFVAELSALPPAQRGERLRWVIGDVARLIRELHRRRLSHRDLKAANILLQMADGRWQKPPSFAICNLQFAICNLQSCLYLIDLVGVRRHRKLRKSQRVQDLARLHASFFRNPAITQTDKLRFLRVYLQSGLFGRVGWKDWWRAIDQATAAKIARNYRSGRPLA